MDRGTYVAASAGLYNMRKLDVAVENLVNANTPGFKRQTLITEEQPFSATLASSMSLNDPYAEGDHRRTPGVVNVATAVDFSPGPITNTANPLDVALRNAKDFFVINGPAGPEYTRAGNFRLNSEGALVTPDGAAVLGDGGQLIVEGAGAAISPSGELVAGGQPVGRLQVMRFQDTAVLEPVGNTRYRIRTGAAAAPEQVEAEVLPQALEMSNVSAISSIVDLITAQRGFQAYTKSAETIDGLNQFAVTRIGSPPR